MKSTLFAVALLAIAALSNAVEDFLCDPIDPKIVNVYGNRLTCPDSLICNTKPSGTKPKPCVATTAICEYSCSADKSNVIINGIWLACPANKECNSGKTSCTVCEDKPCNKNAYVCDDVDPTRVTVGGFAMTCPTAFMCNKEYVFPCSPCIEEGTNPPARRLTRSFLLKSYHA